MLDQVAKGIMRYVPSLKPREYVAAAKAAPAVSVGLLMIGAAGVTAFVWNRSAGRVLGKTRGKF